MGFEAVSKEKIILLGGGGHCRSCIDVIEQEGRYRIAGIVERCDAIRNNQVLGYPVLGSDDDLSVLRKQYSFALVTVGQIKSPVLRIKLYKRLLALDFALPVIVSPKAYVSRYAEIGRGTIVMHHALVNAGAKIGQNCIVNTKALVEHDAVIGENCHIAPGAVISGGVRIGKGSFLGANSMCKENIALDEETIVGGGGIVLQTIRPK